jgi:outer membrane protein assembly factor BamB
MRVNSAILLPGVVLAFSAAAQSNWPHWRGPLDQGSSETGTYPAWFSASSNCVWKAELPGKGCSTPIVWAKQIFVTCPVNGDDGLLAYDWSGKPLWQTALGPERSGKNAHGSGSNPSPITDGRRLFAFYKSGHFAAIDLKGKILWQTDLVARYGRDNLYWDFGSSPVLTEHDVIMTRLHHDDSYVAAFDKQTGNLHWKVARNYETPLEGDHSYASPLVIHEHGGEALLVLGGEHLTAHSAADGHVIWSCGDFNPEAKKNWVPVASPVVAGDLTLVPYGRGAALHGIRLGGAGDVTATHRAWIRSDTGSFVSTPAVYKGRVYVLQDHGPQRGTVDCIDPANGKKMWRGVFPKTGAEYYASPTVADGKLYAAREDGVVLVAKIEDKFEMLAENDLGEPIIASPVPIQNRLLIRAEKTLFCFGTK